ncbi:antibiotic biosynthesis monooxygenase [Burkholderia cepacia]|uniref:putative quinol monooxygenase n=1 Tax=Burkholderia cepacia TaxID=292 RepID=UPI000755AAE2|nr:putative quinol monooxygenase [Burkholderia cepacia]KVS24855.1 antibiotic biosynthesis monooxygenase [Burkholderia cepacia]MCA8120684.1 antibiotic biosynthesis monooxygenase [Burkholderia cepacia]
MKKEGLVVVATVVARSGNEDVLREALKELVPYARTEPGFIQYDLHESADTPGQFVFYEIWEDEAALETHSNTEFAKAFGARAGQWIESVSLSKFRKIT